MEEHKPFTFFGDVFSLSKRLASEMPSYSPCAGALIFVSPPSALYDIPPLKETNGVPAMSPASLEKCMQDETKKNMQRWLERAKHYSAPYKLILDQPLIKPIQLTERASITQLGPVKDDPRRIRVVNKGETTAIDVLTSRLLGVSRIEDVTVMTALESRDTFVVFYSVGCGDHAHNMFQVAMRHGQVQHDVICQPVNHTH